MNMVLYPLSTASPAPSPSAASIDGVLATLAGVALAAAGALCVYFFTVRQRRMDEKKAACAQAIADALAWLELPYRIRRRVDDNPETLRTLANQMHQLQERLLFHQNWLLIEIPQATDAYSALVSAVRRVAAASLQDAWRAAPIKDAASMNIGSLDLGSVDTEVITFAEVVRSRFSWWKLWQD